MPSSKKSERVIRKRRPNPRRSTDSSSSWLSWWPLLLGIAITLAAVKIAEILPLMGADGLWKLKLLYPYPLLLKQQQLGLAEQTSDDLSQFMLYAQWVLYGLYASLAIHWTSRGRALMQVLAIHAVGFGALWVLSPK